jgi:hypothetical protein
LEYDVKPLKKGEILKLKKFKVLGNKWHEKRLIIHISNLERRLDFITLQPEKHISHISHIMDFMNRYNKASSQCFFGL